MDKFELMLSPISKRTFFTEYWDQRPALIRNNATPHKFNDLPSVDRLPQLLAGELHPDAQWTKMHVTVKATILDTTQTVRQLGFVPLSAIEPLYNAGASLCFSPLDGASPALREMTEAVKNQTTLAGDVGATCYLTPPQSGGEMHFDSQHVFFCQVSGEKHWTVSSKPALRYPPIGIGAKTWNGAAVKTAMSEIGLDILPPEECELTQMVVRPGDVLYLPPGTWHEPRTKGMHSLHYTLTLIPLGFWHLLFAALRVRMMKRSEWRQDLRFFDLLPRTDHDRIQFVAQRLDELRQDLTGISADDVVRVLDSIPEPVRQFFRTF